MYITPLPLTVLCGYNITLKYMYKLTVIIIPLSIVTESNFFSCNGFYMPHYINYYNVVYIMLCIAIYTSTVLSYVHSCVC